LAAVTAVALALSAAVAGCSDQHLLHPALQLRDQDIDAATRRGQAEIAACEAPEDAFAYCITDVNERVSSDVILRSAGICWPADRLAYEIARAGDPSDAGVRRAVAAGRNEVERELMLVASIQLPKTRDPASIRFALRTSGGAEYPPIAVDIPILLRDVHPTFDTSAPPAGLYYYVLHFPVRGGPGIPPIGPGVTSLTLVVADDTSEATATFPMPAVQQ
jgi:hypothetical protein